jgi:hypothetical protein
MADGVTQLDPNLAPNAAQTFYPLPKLVTSTGPSGVFTSEGPLINGAPMPGQWLLTAAKRVFGWQVVAGNYLSGARLVPIGDPLLECTYSIRIWTSSDAQTFRNLLRTTLKKGAVSIGGTTAGTQGATPGLISQASVAALGIDDPALKDVGCTSVVIKSVSPLMNPLVTSGGKGPWTASIEFIEYRPFKQAGPIPDQAIPDQGPVTPSAYNAAQQAGGAMNAGASQLQANAAQQTLPNQP